MYETCGTAGGPTRRTVLASLGAASAFTLAGCVGDSDDDEDELDEGGILVGVSIPDDDGRTREGQRLLDGYELAVEHINSGSGAITEEPWHDIGSGDVLGGEVELVVEDTGGTGSGARESAEALVEQGVDVLTGGMSREEGLAIQAVADEQGVIYMGGFVSADEVGGGQCSRYAFHEMYNVEIAVESLARQLVDEFGAGSSVTFAQLYPDNEFGEAFSRAFESRLGAESGWFQPRRVRTPEGRSYEGDIQSELDAGRDLLVLNYYGLDGLTALRDFESAVDPDDDVVVAVPIIGPRMAEDAGSALEDVFGTVHWLPGLGGGFSNALEDEWSGSTDVPMQFGHLAYVQLCQYVAAAARAGSLDADAVISELEGHEYDVGTGRQLLRECDHQAMRYAPVVQGRDEVLQESGRYYELVASIPDGADDPPYDCDGGPAWSCDL